MKSYKELVAQANAVITTMSVAEVAAQVGREDVVLVDLRGDTEVATSGTLPGAIHVQRGMLEFVIDPTSPYHNPVLGSDKAFIFYCASGGRSALAAQQAQAMGLPHVAHMGGGLKAWKEAGYKVEPYQQA